MAAAAQPPSQKRTLNNVYFHLWKRFTDVVHPPEDAGTRKKYFDNLEAAVNGHFNLSWTHPCEANDNTLLHLCILSGDIETLKVLLDKTKINITWYLSPLNKHGHTPLMTALSIGDYECVRILLNAFHDAEVSYLMTHFMKFECKTPFLNQDDLALYIMLSMHKPKSQDNLVGDGGSVVERIARSNGFLLTSEIIDLMKQDDPKFEIHKAVFNQVRKNHNPAPKYMEFVTVEETPIDALPFFTQYIKTPEVISGVAVAMEVTENQAEYQAAQLEKWAREVREDCLAGMAFFEGSYTHEPHGFDPLGGSLTVKYKNLVILDCLRVAALCRNWAWFVKAIYDLSFVQWDPERGVTMDIKRCWNFILDSEELLRTPITDALRSRKAELVPLWLLGSGNRTGEEMSDAFAATFLFMPQSRFDTLDNAVLHLTGALEVPSPQHILLLEPGEKRLRCSVLISRLICLFSETDTHTFSAIVQDFLTPLYTGLLTPWNRIRPPNPSWFDCTDENKFLQKPKCMSNPDFLDFVVNVMLVEDSFLKDEDKYLRYLFPVQKKLMKIAFESGADLSKLVIPLGNKAHRKFVAGTPNPPDIPPKPPLVVDLLLTFDAVLIHKINKSGIFESDGDPDNFVLSALADNHGQINIPAELEHVLFTDRLIGLDFPKAAPNQTPKELQRTEGLHYTTFHIAAEKPIGAAQELYSLVLDALSSNKLHFLFFQNINGNTFLHLFFSNPEVIKEVELPTDTANKKAIFSVFSLLKDLDSAYRKVLFRKKNKENVSLAYLMMSNPAWSDLRIRETVKQCGDPLDFDFVTPQGRGHRAPKDLRAVYKDYEVEGITNLKRAASATKDAIARGFRTLGFWS